LIKSMNCLLSRGIKGNILVQDRRFIAEGVIRDNVGAYMLEGGCVSEFVKQGKKKRGIEENSFYTIRLLDRVRMGLGKGEK